MCIRASSKSAMLGGANEQCEGLAFHSSKSRASYGNQENADSNPTGIVLALHTRIKKILSNNHS